MKLIQVCFAGFLLSTSPNLSSKPLTLYVAANGDDQGPGEFARPMATVSAALKAVRTARQKDPAKLQDGATIILRGGEYFLNEPLLLTAEDSGASDKAPLTIAAQPNEKPILSGGRQISSWKQVPGKANLWQAQIPEAREGRWYFRSLFVNGQRKQRARTPNKGFFRIDGASPKDRPVKLKFHPGDIKKEWADAGDVEVIALLAWADFRMFIRAVDETNHIATLSADPRSSNLENNARYFIENAPDALDSPGEWQLNRKAGVVTYWPTPGEDMANAKVTAGHLDDLMILQGDVATKKAMQHVVLRGLTFSYTDWPMPENGYVDTQAAVSVRGDLRAEAATDCAVEDCTFSHLAGYALELGRGCQRWRVVGNEISDMGGGGIRVGEPAKRSDPFDANRDHIISDNQIHHLGLVYPPAVGVFILQSGGNRVAHNHIHHLYYTAVSVGWNWGYQETPCRENIVEFNHMHDIGQFMLSDMAAVYTLGIQKGTIIRNNLIHDVNSFTYGGWGLYPDEGSTDIVWENNVVYHCKSAGFHQHYGRENIVRNNIFACNREAQLMRTREEQHVSFIFTNNIVYYDSGTLLGSNWKNEHFQMDKNIYFDARPGAKPDLMKFSGATWEQWHARGHDTDSVIADPIFVDSRNFDFRLRPDSPALKLGFKPIDLSDVGVRKHHSYSP